LNNSRFIDNGNGNFTWSTNYTDSGVYLIEANVTDGVPKCYIYSRLIPEMQNCGVLSDTKVFSVTITDTNQKPIIQPISDVQILEDSDWIFVATMNATDNDGNITGYAVVSQNIAQVDCIVNEYGNISVKPAANWFVVGNNAASCTVAAIDNSGSSSNVSFKINVTAVNDAPTINSFSPDSSIRILKGVTQNFNIVASDVDGDSLGFSWFVNGIFGSSGNSFNKQFLDNGNYNISSVVTDGMFNVSYDWNVFVGDTKDFTCSQVNGFTCGVDEYCSVNFLSVLDSSSCCSVACNPILFSKIETCQKTESQIDINIKEPKSNNKFKPGEIITGTVKISNNLLKDKDFNVNVVLYDLTNNQNLDDNGGESLSISAGDYENLDFSLTIPDDADESHNYAVYVNARDDNNNSLCNENYVPIDVKRDKYEVIFNSLSLDKDNADCRDTVTATLKVQNIGNSNSNVYLTLENKALGIYNKTDSFKLERYDNKDEATKKIIFDIPQNATLGNYTLIATAFSDSDTQNQTEISLNVGSCLKQASNSVQAQVISLTTLEPQLISLLPLKNSSKVDSKYYILIFALVLGILLILLAIFAIQKSRIKPDIEYHPENYK